MYPPRDLERRDRRTGRLASPARHADPVRINTTPADGRQWRHPVVTPSHLGAAGAEITLGADRSERPGCVRGLSMTRHITSIRQRRHHLGSILSPGTAHHGNGRFIKRPWRAHARGTDQHLHRRHEVTQGTLQSPPRQVGAAGTAITCSMGWPLASGTFATARPSRCWRRWHVPGQRRQTLTWGDLQAAISPTSAAAPSSWRAPAAIRDDLQMRHAAGQHLDLLGTSPSMPTPETIARRSLRPGHDAPCRQYHRHRQPAKTAPAR